METEDIPRDLLQTYDTSGITHLKFDKIMAELLACIDPYLYIRYVTTDEKGFNIMYAEFLKSPCVTLDASIIFWFKLITDLYR